MRLLFVNHLHPDTGLVGAVRLHRFAEELAARGHQVLLLCANHQANPDTPETFERCIIEHDWSAPLLLSVRDDSPARRRASADHKWRLLRRACTAASLVVHGGPFWRWQRSARAFRRPIQRLFAPDLAYATFGNLDALAIARDYARASEIPWVMDIKDPASGFIPKPLAGRLMRRYRDASAVTLNAEFQRRHNHGWADSKSRVIYSGVEAATATADNYDATQVAMIGAVYDDHAAEILLRGFAAWHQKSNAGATLHYFGVDSARVGEIAARFGITNGLVIEGQIPRNQLLARCARMAALQYTARPQRTFHHKLLELAALGRPIIESPAEGEEAEALCARYAINHTAVADAVETQHALVKASLTPTAKMERLLDEMSWPSAAARLEEVFVAVLGKHGPHGKYP